MTLLTLNQGKPMKKIFILLLLIIGIAASGQEEINELEPIEEEEEMFVDAQEEQAYAQDVEELEDETSSVETYDSATDFGE
jgi:hypothetical protein